MRLRHVLFPLAAVLIASAALADYGKPPAPPSQPAPSSTSGSVDEKSPRMEAERYYSDAYDDVVKAGKDVEKGKKESADKRYRRALERSRNAVALDTTYHEAWNLVGFTSRKLGDYPGSFAAYRTALRLKPDFALAHEYYGEGLLETGDLPGAEQQLAALRASGTPELIAELEGAIAKYRTAHPAPTAATAAAPASTTPAADAPADTSKTPATN